MKDIAGLQDTVEVRDIAGLQDTVEVRDIAGPQDTVEVRDIAATLGRSRTRKCCDTESHCLGKS